MEFKKELDLAKKLIKKAYVKILNKKIEDVNEKTDNSLVTNLDYLCEKFIIDNVLQAFPDDVFLSEESFANNEVKNRTWVLDPIDGTNCFIKGYLNWGIQLAFLYENEVQFSIIYLPKLNELFVGVLNEGVFVNNKKLDKLKPLPLKLSVVEYVGSYSTNKNNLQVVYNALKKKCLMQIAPWSACYIFTNLATNKSNLVISDKLKPWDKIPGEFMVMQLGAKKITLAENISIYSACPEAEEILIKSFEKGKK